MRFPAPLTTFAPRSTALIACEVGGEAGEVERAMVGQRIGSAAPETSERYRTVPKGLSWR
jgi:hypothetical protein